MANNSRQPIRLRSVADEHIDAAKRHNSASDNVVVCGDVGLVAADVVVVAVANSAANGDCFADAA